MGSFASSSPAPRGSPHTVIENAGHFLQEDQGERLAALVVDFIAG
jgi:haloalkane dehalogenase